MSIATRIVRIGNSQGVRLPRHVLERSGLSGEIEMDVEQGRIVLRPRSHPRAGWDEAFAEMAQRGDDAPIDTDAPESAWDEWEW